MLFEGDVTHCRQTWDCLICGQPAEEFGSYRKEDLLCRKCAGVTLEGGVELASGAGLEVDTTGEEA